MLEAGDYDFQAVISDKCEENWGVGSQRQRVEYDMTAVRYMLLSKNGPLPVIILTWRLTKGAEKVQQKRITGNSEFHGNAKNALKLRFF